MRRFFATVVASAALAVGVGHATAAPAPLTALKPCGVGYVHAILSWRHKCLRAGEFCKVGNREYLRYGFFCPASGHLQRR